MPNEKRTVFFISDSTAITAETLGHSLMAQFDHVQFHQFTLPFVDSAEKAMEAISIINEIAKITETKPIVFSTLVNAEIRQIIKNCNCIFFDSIDTFLTPLEKELDMPSSKMVGSYHKFKDNVYDVRMDAVNYALGHDDGMTMKNFDMADVILVGVSRTGKTPTCVYLALQFGIFAANYPLTEENFANKDRKHIASLTLFKEKLFGLTINPARLQKIRSERWPNSRYASLAQCQTEISMAEELFAAEDIPFINVTMMSVEEIAAHILQFKKLQRRLFS
ncbi:MAG: kinase/pyrophosphorylase [Deltaproteobacteria bacterium]|nr:kinase/pyrophosphorylase [Deltaproteobacteria bacterium]